MGRGLVEEDGKGVVGCGIGSDQANELIRTLPEKGTRQTPIAQKLGIRTKRTQADKPHRYTTDACTYCVCIGVDIGLDVRLVEQRTGLLCT